MELNEDPLQQAFQYFIINRCSFSGATLSGGFSEESSKKRYTEPSINKIQSLDLSNVLIENLDFYDFMNDKKNAFKYGKIALELEPTNERLKTNLEFYQNA